MQYLVSRVLILLSFSLLSPSSFSQGIHTKIEKIDTVTWTVSYESENPLDKIAFRRNPDDSRTSRWKPVDDSFEIIFENMGEFIVRKDGKKFTQITLYVTPTHFRFSKDYAPFSPFSDGGILFHSGRFFACDKRCEDSPNEWSLTLLVPEQDHILLDGKTVGSQTSWLDSNSGRQIYVGQQSPRYENGFITIIDENLPKEIKKSFDLYIPQLTEYFESKLGVLEDTTNPSLFVSYSPTKGPSVRAGVLPNQIFVHLDNDDIERLSSENDLLNNILWTLAHEVAHYFQEANKLHIEQSASWIHEGHAELLALDALTRLSPSSAKYAEDRISGFSEKCSEDLQTTSLKDAAKNGAFNAYYTCGFLIYKTISNTYNNKLNLNPYTIWTLLESKAGSSEKITDEVFVNMIAQLGDDKLAKRLRAFIRDKHDDPSSAIKNFINQK